MIYMSYDVFPQKDVPFGVLLTMLPIRRLNCLLGGVNRGFQAKHAKY